MPSRAAAYLRLTGLSLALKFWTVARTQRAFYGRDGLWPADDASRAERREVLAWAGLALAIACAVGRCSEPPTEADRIALPEGARTGRSKAVRP